jgi:hypothetical protein
VEWECWDVVRVTRDVLRVVLVCAPITHFPGYQDTLEWGFYDQTFLTEFGNRKDSQEVLNDSHARLYWIDAGMQGIVLGFEKRICESNRPENGENWRDVTSQTRSECEEMCE